MNTVVMSQRLRYLCYGLCALAFSLLICIGLIEIICRLSGQFVPPLWLARQKYNQQQGQQYIYPSDNPALYASHNRLLHLNGKSLADLGYRTKYSKDTGRNGVLIVGDSMAAGLTVQVEESFASLLDIALAPVPVVNLGVIGAGLENMHYQLEMFVDLLTPRLVIAAIYADDLRRHGPDWLLKLDRPTAILENGRIRYVLPEEAIRHRFLYYHSRLYQIDNYWIRTYRERISSHLFTYGYLYKLNASLIQQMRIMANRYKGHLLIVFIPSRKQLENRVAKFIWPRALYKICRDEGIPLLDLTSRLAVNPGSYYNAWGGVHHLNAQGHLAAYESIRKYMDEKHLLGEVQ
jgi:hypothetical protein